METSIHHGRNVKRFREMLGIKQESLANELGQDWNQRKISILEGKEIIEDELLQKVADILKVPIKSIKNFTEEMAVSIISNTFTSNDHSTLNAINLDYTFNPINKIIELYELLLKSERDKFELLKSTIQKHD